MRATDTFRDAEALAEFANLDPTDANAVEYFRNNYPNFAPVEWWNYKYNEFTLVQTSAADDLNLTGGIEESPARMWQVTQEEIQRAWENQFQFETVFGLTQLLKCVFVAPPETVWTQEYMHFSDGMFDELIGAKTYSFHTAVLYLHAHPKQAKQCEKCGKYFVTVAGKRTMCIYPDADGDTCSQKQIREQHLKWWETVGAKQRKAKQKGERKAAKKKTAR